MLENFRGLVLYRSRSLRVNIHFVAHVKLKAVRALVHRSELKIATSLFKNKDFDDISATICNTCSILEFQLVHIVVLTTLQNVDRVVPSQKEENKRKKRQKDYFAKIGLGTAENGSTFEPLNWEHFGQIRPTKSLHFRSEIYIFAAKNTFSLRNKKHRKHSMY